MCLRVTRPTRSVSTERSSVTTCETFATESFERPVLRAGRRTLPGASAHVARQRYAHRGRDATPVNASPGRSSGTLGGTGGAPAKACTLGLGSGRAAMASGSRTGAAGGGASAGGGAACRGLTFAFGFVDLEDHFGRRAKRLRIRRTQRTWRRKATHRRQPDSTELHVIHGRFRQNPPLVKWPPCA